MMMKVAQVAELVDALASGASGRKVVEVRVFSWAPSEAGVCIHVTIQKQLSEMNKAE